MIIEWETGPHVEVTPSEHDSQEMLMTALKIGDDMSPWVGKVIDRKGKMKVYLPKDKITIELRNMLGGASVLISIGIPDQNPQFGKPLSRDKLISISSNAKARMSVEEHSYMNLAIIEATLVFNKLQKVK